MSRLGINTGVNPNDGTGDPIRIAMGKINDNFSEIYNSFGDGFSLVSYASTSGISTLSRNLTGNPIINVSGLTNTGVTTTEHLEVRNITSTGIVTATRFVGDGSQLTNVTSTSAGIEIYDEGIYRGVARKLNFGENITAGNVNGNNSVDISVSQIVLTSPNGTKYRLTVNNSGVLSTVIVP